MDCLAFMLTFYPVCKKECTLVQFKEYLTRQLTYRTHAIITGSWFETALDYKPRILDPKIEEFPCLVHKLSVTLTAPNYKPQWKMGKKYTSRGL